MTPERWQQIKGVLDTAVALASVEREAYLAAACADDPELRREVDSLILSHEEASEGFLEPVWKFRDPPPRAVESAIGPGAELGAYQVHERIGSGGMGIVYRAFDRERRQLVALKTIKHASAGEIYDLKREFRGLADIAHPNLVSLYELVVDESYCFFTMELIDGVDIVRALQGPPTPARVARIADLFAQVAEGLTALHRHGRLHRDVKPSNILVTHDDRVVILDFGLITDTESETSRLGARAAGTPAYMAPEDIAGGAAAASSDWYGVGITLYQALTGRVPFEGSFAEQHRLKSAADPPAPAAVVAGVPEDLSRLCADLVSRDCDRRRSGWTALRGLRSAATAPSHERAAPGVESDALFVGREATLAALDRAFSAPPSGGAVSVVIQGPSGIGKSALVRRFLERVPSSPPVVVLRGRCYEQEAVPYKALDGIIDSLGQYLNSLPTARREAVLPPDFPALSQMFPVLAHVDAITHRSSTSGPAIDRVELRRRGLAALRRLLVSLAALQRVVLFIDDLHWADADSAALLGELLGPPDPPALFTVLCFRSEESAAKPFLHTLIDGLGANPRLDLALGPLSDIEAASLIESLDVRASIESTDLARATREAEGNPLLLKQVAHYIAGALQDSGASPTFAAMLEARTALLSPDARQFLDTLAVCGRPTPTQVVFRACGFAGDERSLVASLRSAHFVRSSGSTARVELYHDRIRTTLAAMVPSDAARRIHGAVAQALVDASFNDPEDLFDHYLGAGDAARAAAEAARAAARANESLAFERAVHFYRRALAVAPESAAANALKRDLADALAHAGRPAEAADMYLEAAKQSHLRERLDLQRQAAEQLMAGGHIDRGLDVMRTVLSAVGLSLARGPRSAFLSLMLSRVRLWRGGLGFVPRAEADVAEADLLRIDACWSAVTGLTTVDPIRAAEFQTRHLMFALDAGEPYRVARALALQVIFQAAGDRLIGARSFVRPEDAMKAAEEVGDPHVIALATLTAGMREVMRGCWHRAAPLCERALELLREKCAGATWEINQAQFLALGSLLYLGRVGEVSGRLPELLASARERGNLFVETELRTRLNLVWLAADQPDEGARQAKDALKAWAHEGFQRQHYSMALALIQTALYRGDADEAWRLISESWAPMTRSFMLRIPLFRFEMLYMRARSALQKAGDARQTRRFLPVVKRDIRQIRKEEFAWSSALATLLDAAVAFNEGRSDIAVDALEKAADEFAGQDMRLYVAAANRRRGGLVGGSAGAALIASADAWMAGQQIRNPAAMTRLLASGFPD